MKHHSFELYPTYELRPCKANVIDHPISAKLGTNLGADGSMLAKLIIFSVIVLGATLLLITSSLDVFGSGWLAWIKAIILELGILALSILNIELKLHWMRIGEWFLCRGALLFLLSLSLSVLHTGVESQRSEGITTAESTSTILAELIAERDLWQKTYDGYAENRITDRRDAMKEISRLNKEIRTERAASLASPAGTVVHMKSNTEMMMRAALLLLNIIFGHKLAQVLATIKWPPLREEERLIS